MDMDGDGVLSMFELEFFYEEQCERMEGMGIEPLPFQDLLCQMLDLVKPECPGKEPILILSIISPIEFQLKAHKWQIQISTMI